MIMGCEEEVRGIVFVGSRLGKLHRFKSSVY